MNLRLYLFFDEHDPFSGFIKFWSSERNTENTMSNLYFNEEQGEKSEENTSDNEDFHHSLP